MKPLRSFCTDDRGQDMVEYVLVLAAIALAGAAAMVGMGTDINTIWSLINSRLTSASN